MAGGTVKALLVCAWCKRFIREIETVNGGTSHGICPECFAREMERDHKMDESTYTYQPHEPSEWIEVETNTKRRISALEKQVREQGDMLTEQAHLIAELRREIVARRQVA